MPVFNDSENKTFTILPEGDYIFRVTSFESMLSTTAKTNGSPRYEVEFSIEGHDGVTVRDVLIDHPTCAFKIDTFVKSAGVKLAKGEAFEFRADLAKKAGVRWVNPIGLRGWFKLVEDTLPPREGKKEIKVNKVAVYYTNKEKIQPIAQEDEPFDL